MPACTGAGKGEGAGDLGDLLVSFPSPHSVPSPPWCSSSPDFDRNQRGTSLCSDWANGRRRAGAEGRSHGRWVFSNVCYSVVWLRQTGNVDGHGD